MSAPLKPPPGGKSSKDDGNIKLSKEQKIRVGQMIRIENRISVCQDYIQLWSKFFQFFADDIHLQTIKPEEEKGLFQAITSLARQHFLFCELMGDTFERGNEILDVLTASVSLSQIKAMDEGTFSKLELDWHSLLLDMNRALGRLLRQMPAGMKINEMIEQAKATAQADKEKAADLKNGVKKSGGGLLGMFKRNKKA